MIVRQVLLPLMIATLTMATASAAPPVQVFVPGFAVRELPVEVPNINCLRYRPDGKLLALCYDGSVWLLSDGDGDGLEDRADPLWKSDGTIKSPLEMVVTPEGVYISASRGIFLLHEGRLEKIPVDWAAPINATGAWIDGAGVDALGLARDAEGNLYVAIGTPDFTNPYLLKEGKAGYDVKGDRGAILKFSADRSRRELYATGVRFGVSLAFNQEGDLFCTDQEGASWLANGNPFDELLHIKPGRHYGFPPSHPSHLPGVVDEPSVFDYAPQHQSTCGLTFNESVNGGRSFGPEFWAHDAFVAGYSRGKLYRTTLAKSQAGYVARNELFACLGMLTMDACVTPDGGLVVACHSGKPDWGSGPSGKGKLYKIGHSDPALATPVLAWAQSATELRIAFDRPLTVAQLADLGSGAHIEYGRYVGTGDRFESLWPGYKVVQDQKRTARNALKILDVKTSQDRRNLIVTTATHVEAVPHAITLPGLGRPRKADARRAEMPQMSETDLQYDLTGVEAIWQAESGNDRWSGWLPHLSLDVARHFTRSSVEHDQCWARLNRRGTL
ncbi:MAG TPA: hypothetical protein VL475_00170, partial [Planctomycetaceae bacterium]|nr:hypothetical protein [Planctomycetaceae bacterium]